MGTIINVESKDMQSIVKILNMDVWDDYPSTDTLVSGDTWLQDVGGQKCVMSYDGENCKFVAFMDNAFIIDWLNDEAERIEYECRETLAEGLHAEAHQKMDIARALRMASEWIDRKG